MKKRLERRTAKQRRPRAPTSIGSHHAAQTRPLCSAGCRCRRESVEEANVVLVFYPDPVSGYPPMHANDSFPVLHGINGMLFLNLG